MSLMQDTLYNMVAWFVGSRSSIATQPGRRGKDGEVEGPKVVRKGYLEAQLAEFRDRAENISNEGRAGVTDRGRSRA
jgi:hypothetical protein